jgi:hypothetical protein
MQKIAHISFIADPALTKTLLVNSGIPEDFLREDTLQSLGVEWNSRSYKRLMAELAKHGIIPTESLIKEFTSKELEEADYLHLLAMGKEVTTNDNQFNENTFENCCALCGNGGTQRAPLRLKRLIPSSKAPVLYLTEFEAYLISDFILAEFYSKSLRGWETRKVLDAKGKTEWNGWNQLIWKNTLPMMPDQSIFPLVPKQMGEEMLCPCGNRGRNLPDRVVYGNHQKKEFQDFNHTAEWLGGGFSTAPLYIISQRVYSLLKTLKIRPLKAEPVLFR